MIQLIQEEIWTFNILNVTAQNAQAELQRVVAARVSYIKLLESKYSATFDETTGKFNEKLENK